MWITPNPYRWDKIDLRLFCGRTNLLREVIDGLKGGHSFALVGGRRMGKTMFLRKVEAELQTQIASSLTSGLLVLPVYVDTLQFPAPFAARSLYTFVIKKVESALKTLKLFKRGFRSTLSYFAQFPGEENRGFKDALQRLLTVVPCYLQVTVLIDEIERIVNSEWGQGFFDNWRQLLHNEPELSLHLNAVIAGAKEMSTIAKDIGSPLANILTWKDLTLFSQTETAELVNGPTGGRIAPSVVKRIRHQTGGHPYLIQYLMHNLCNFDLYEAGDRLRGAVQLFLDDHGVQFRLWWEKCDAGERQVYAHLAGRRGAVSKRAIIDLVGDTTANNALAVLCHTGIVRQLPRQERYQVAGAMFRAWFKRHGTRGADYSSLGFDVALAQKLRTFDTHLADLYISAWAILDTQMPDYSGAAANIRSVLEKVIDGFAPDEEVIHDPIGKPELDSRGRPTRGTKTRFIVRQRQLSVKASEIEYEMQHLEALLDGLPKLVTRAYGRASQRTHEGASYEQARRCLKQLESVLEQLL